MTACMEAERLASNRAMVGLNKLIDDFPISKVLAGNRDIFEIIKRNAKFATKNLLDLNNQNVAAYTVHQ
jgi:hypothetical protein